MRKCSTVVLEEKKGLSRVPPEGLFESSGRPFWVSKVFFLVSGDLFEVRGPRFSFNLYQPLWISTSLHQSLAMFMSPYQFLYQSLSFSINLYQSPPTSINLYQSPSVSIFHHPSHLISIWLLPAITIINMMVILSMARIHCLFIGTVMPPKWW